MKWMGPRGPEVFHLPHHKHGICYRLKTKPTFYIFQSFKAQMANRAWEPSSYFNFSWLVLGIWFSQILKNGILKKCFPQFIKSTGDGPQGSDCKHICYRIKTKLSLETYLHSVNPHMTKRGRRTKQLLRIFISRSLCLIFKKNLTKISILQKVFPQFIKCLLDGLRRPKKSPFVQL